MPFFSTQAKADLRVTVFSPSAFSRKIRCMLGLTALTCLSACAPQDQSSVYDPIEPVNRAIFSVNEVADSYILRPVAEGYQYVVPAFGRQRISNVLDNLSQPLVLVNSILQGDAENAFSSFWRFALNTTFGIGGLFDFAGENTNLSVRDEDFGQTLAVWGVGEGPYLVLPLMGPSNLRDASGGMLNWYADPLNYAHDRIVISRSVLAALEGRVKTLKLTDDIYDTSLDPYVTFRSAYTQRRRGLVANGAISQDYNYDDMADDATSPQTTKGN